MRLEYLRSGCTQNLRKNKLNSVYSQEETLKMPSYDFLIIHIRPGISDLGINMF